MTLREERCCLCDEATDHAGIHDDSLYLESGIGPLCDDCYNESPEGKIGKLKEEITASGEIAEGLRGALAAEEFAHGQTADSLEKAEVDLAESRQLTPKQLEGLRRRANGLFRGLDLVSEMSPEGLEVSGSLSAAVLVLLREVEWLQGSNDDFRIRERDLRLRVDFLEGRLAHTHWRKEEAEAEIAALEISERSKR